MTKTVTVDIGTGQSGMMNFGCTGAGFPGGWTSDAGIQIWNSTASAWQTYLPGTNSDGAGGPLWGPEAEFLRQKRILRPDVTRYFIKLAVGGSPVYPQPGANADYSNFTDGTGKNWTQFYSAFVAATAAIPGGALAVIEDWLCVDGESDGSAVITPSDGTAANDFFYNKWFQINATRQRLGIQNCNAIISRIFPNYRVGGSNPIVYKTTIRAAQDKLPLFVPKCMVVNVDDLTEAPNPYGGHIDPTSTVTQGLRMFNASRFLLGV